jgi:tetratricopeptide (TPR) repeat protein
LEDIFAVQDDIAQSVVKELRTTLLGAEGGSRASAEVRAELAKATKGRSTSPEAHRLYLQARYLIGRRTREDTAKGIGYLREALELTPRFALAWAELSLACSREADVGWVAVAEGYDRARAAVERALALEPDLAEAHIQLAWIRMIHDWNWSGAEICCRRALELAPGNAQVLHGASALAYTQGRLEEAIVLAHRALEQDPLSAGSYHNLGGMLRIANRLAEAEAAYRKSLELAPPRIATRAALALTVLAEGRGEEATAEAAGEPNDGFRSWALAIIHHAMGREAESQAALRALIEMDPVVWALQIAEVHAVRGEADAAFEWLERAYAVRDGGLSEMKVSPRFRALHGDPRWDGFLKRMGFERSTP